MKIKHAVLIIISLIIIGVAIMILSNPLRKSEEGIRKDMLKLTPIGTSMKETIKVVKSHEKWEIDWVDDDSGYGIGPAGIPGEGYTTEIGEKSMRVCVGEYKSRIFFVVDVVVYLGFDKDSKLVDIAVRKDIDSP